MPCSFSGNNCPFEGACWLCVAMAARARPLLLLSLTPRLVSRSPEHASAGGGGESDSDVDEADPSSTRD
jgi:hypothetical protein